MKGLEMLERFRDSRGAHPVMTLGEVLELALEPKPKLQAVG